MKKESFFFSFFGEGPRLLPAEREFTFCNTPLSATLKDLSAISKNRETLTQDNTGNTGSFLNSERPIVARIGLKT